MKSNSGEFAGCFGLWSQEGLGIPQKIYPVIVAASVTCP